MRLYRTAVGTLSAIAVLSVMAAPLRLHRRRSRSRGPRSSRSSSRSATGSIRRRKRGGDPDDPRPVLRADRRRRLRGVGEMFASASLKEHRVRGRRLGRRGLLPYVHQAPRRIAPDEASRHPHRLRSTRFGRLGRREVGVRRAPGRRRRDAGDRRRQVRRSVRTPRWQMALPRAPILRRCGRRPVGAPDLRTANEKVTGNPQVVPLALHRQPGLSFSRTRRATPKALRKEDPLRDSGIEVGQSPRVRVGGWLHGLEGEGTRRKVRRVGKPTHRARTERT